MHSQVLPITSYLEVPWFSKEVLLRKGSQAHQGIDSYTYSTIKSKTLLPALYTHFSEVKRIPKGSRRELIHRVQGAMFTTQHKTVSKSKVILGTQPSLLSP